MARRRRASHRSVDGRNPQARGSLSPFLDALSQMVVVSVPKRQAHCEDFPLNRISDRAAMGAVFDGCGGIGGRTYAEFKGHSGAYIASRAAAEGAYILFDELAAKGFPQSANMPLSLAGSLKDSIDIQLALCSNAVRSRSALKGSLQKSFPTTVAGMFAYCNPAGEGVSATVFWAGDSRCYWLDSEGLHQLTQDDVDQTDAQANIHEDGALSNIASASNPYAIHERHFDRLGAGVLIAATDGCFGYLPTPMHFEQVLLGTLQEASSLDEWQEKLAESFAGYSGDDATLVAHVLNFDTFGALQSQLAQRYGHVVSKYTTVYDANPQASERALWDSYRVGYCQYLEDYDG